MENLVKQVIKNLISQSILFTAFDVAVEVKKHSFHAKYTEIKDIVRANYEEMKKMGYERSPIQMTLADSSQVDVLLYHPVSESWDLDMKYDSQMRNTYEKLASQRWEEMSNNLKMIP